MHHIKPLHSMFEKLAVGVCCVVGDERCYYCCGGGDCCYCCVVAAAAVVVVADHFPRCLSLSRLLAACPFLCGFVCGRLYRSEGVNTC